ncbi:MAG: hypothetical protein RLZZ306_1712 [Bacteroidota bacterium]
MSYKLIILHNFNNIPSGFFNFQQYFFNESEHLQHQKGEYDCLTFHWQNIQYQTIEGRLSVIIKDKIACSPLRATFGGIEFFDKILEEDLLQFLQQIILYLQSLKIERIDINSYPEGYITKNQNKILHNCFLKLDFHVKYIEQNYEIPITEKSFYETVKGSTAKQLLRTFKQKGYTFQQELNPDLKKIHEFISHSRERKNRPMTMSLEQLRVHFEKFPNNFKIFSVTHSKKMVAVGITIKINKEILYTFYLADDENYLKNSPTTFLLSGIYEYGKQNNYTLLDFGIATEKGILNEGLAKFKQSLGAKMSEKPTYFLLF